MAVTVARGYHNVIRLSVLNQDTSSAEDTTAAASTLGVITREAGAALTPVVYDKYSSDMESGRTTYLSEGADIPLVANVQRTLPLTADDAVTGALAYFAAHGSAAATATQIAATGVYKQKYVGPGTSIGGANAARTRGFTWDELLKPGVTNDDMNRKYHCGVVEDFTLTLTPGQEATIAAQIRGGGLAESAGATPAVGTSYRNRVFQWNHALLLTHATAGWAAGDITIGMTAAPTLAQCVSDSALTAGPSSLGVMRECSLKITKTIDFIGSLQNTNVDANGAAIVSNASDFIVTGQKAALTVTYMMGDGSVEALRAAAELGTPRGWELWLVHPSAVASGAYAGFKFTMGYAKPVSVVESAAFGPKTLTFTYEAQNNATAAKGWAVSSTSTMTTAYGT